MNKKSHEETEWPVPGVRLKSCPRCEGATETDQNGDTSCLHCGWVKYYQPDEAPDPSDDTARLSRRARKTHKNRGKPTTATGSAS